MSMRTRITVYLQGTMKVYETDKLLGVIMDQWNDHQSITVATHGGGYAVINKDQCPIIEFMGLAR